MKLVSIITPLYNYAHYITDLINSVIAQDYQKWEFIIVDDCSTDNPYPVIKPFLKDDRISYVKLDKNKGYATAKNEGVIRSSGDYIIIIDADDMLFNNSVSRRITALNNNPKRYWLHAKAYEFGGEKPYKMTFRKRAFIRRFKQMQKNGTTKGVWQVIHAQTVVVRREAYLQVGLYDETMRSMSDKEMWARLQYGVGSPFYLDDFVACYRQHGKQMHRSKAKEKMLDRLKEKLASRVKRSKKGDFSWARKLEK